MIKPYYRFINIKKTRETCVIRNAVISSYKYELGGGSRDNLKINKMDIFILKISVTKIM